MIPGRREAIRLRNRRGGVLLAYLAMHQGVATSRADLVDLLWDRASSNGRHSLSQLLYQLKKAKAGPIQGNAEAIWVDRGTIETDVLDFDSAMAKEQFRSAAALIRGDFLGGLEIARLGGMRDWIEEQRDHYLAKYAKAYIAAREDALLRSDSKVVAELEQRLGAISPDFRSSFRSGVGGDRSEVQSKRPPLVGRGDVLRRLQSIWSKVSATGRGSAIAVVGEVGMGKTRVIEAFCSFLSSRKVPILFVNCMEPYSGLPLASLTASIHAARDAAPDAVLRRYHQRLAEALSGGARNGVTSGTMADSAALQKFEALALVISDIAKSTGIVVVVDEVGLADSVSRSLFAYLRRRCDHCSAMFVFSSSPGHGELLGSEDQVIDVGPLSDEQALELAKLVSHGPVVDETELLRIVRRARGNPLFITELMKTRATTTRTSEQLPATLQALLEKRFRTLSQSAVDLLAAICITTPFARLDFSAAAAGYSVPQVAHAQAELEKARLVAFDGSHQRVELHHEVVRRALEHFTGRSLMSRVARRAAALAARNQDIPPAVIAEWFELAGEKRLAYRFALKAGRDASLRAHWTQAIDFFERAVWLAPGSEQRSLAHHELGIACIQCGRYSDGERHLVRAHEHRAGTQIEAHLELARITQAVNFATSNNSQIIAELNRLVDYVAIGDVSGLEAVAYESLIFAAHRTGDATLIWSGVELGRIIAERLEKSGDVARVYAAAGRVASVSGDPGLGNALARDSWEIANRGEDSVVKLHSLLALGSSFYFMGDLHQSRDAFAQAHRLATRGDLEQYLRLTACNLAVLLMDQDELDAAKSMFMESIERDSTMQKMYCLVNLCCLTADENEWAECERFACDLHMLNKEVGANWAEVSAQTFFGLCAIASGNRGRAEEIAQHVGSLVANHTAFGDMSFTLLFQARLAQVTSPGSGADVISREVGRSDLSHVGRLRLKLELARITLPASPRTAWNFADEVAEIARSTGAFAIVRRAEALIVEIARARARRPT